MPRVLIAMLIFTLAACAAQPAPTERPAARTPTPTPTATSASPTVDASPTLAPPATLSPIPLPGRTRSPDAQVGLPSAGCVNGWQRPAPGTPLYEEGQAIVQQHILYDVLVQVEDMRYFTGPDVPSIIEPRHDVVERWYVKTGGGTDMEMGRWLVEKRTEEVKGVSAVAPYDSSGYQSPDWVGFVGEGPASIYPGLPGAWSGRPYDFVTGEGDSGQPGLPAEVVDCLAGT